MNARANTLAGWLTICRTLTPGLLVALMIVETFFLMLPVLVLLHFNP